MRHLITGGSGFLGNLIARRLAARGEFVRVMDLWEDTTRPPEIEFFKGDVTRSEDMARALESIEIVHHNAALVPLTKSGDDFRKVNVEGSRIAAEEAVKKKVRFFIHMSSSAIYGIPERCPITPETLPHPVEIYGRAKWAGEQAVRAAAQAGGMPLLVIRPRTILGEGRLGIFQILFRWIYEGLKVFTVGDGRNRFQFVHAHDLMDAYLCVMDRGEQGIFNVGTDRFGTLGEALERLISHAGSRSLIRSLPVGPTVAGLRCLDALRLSPLAPWHYLSYHKTFFFDVDPLLKLGWKPRYSNDEMLREAYDWFVCNEKKVLQSASPHRRRLKQGLLSVLNRLCP